MERLDSEIVLSEAQLHNASSPIFKLSDDELGLIFLYAALATRYSRGRRKEFLTEVKISHVCSRFRSIAIGQPRIWTHFSEGVIRLRDGRKLERLRAYLARSKSLPISLDFKTEGGGVMSSDDSAWSGGYEDSSSESESASAEVDMHLVEDEDAEPENEDDMDPGEEEIPSEDIEAIDPEDGEGGINLEDGSAALGGEDSGATDGEDTNLDKNDGDRKRSRDCLDALILAIDHIERWQFVDIVIFHSLPTLLKLQQLMKNRWAPHLEYLCFGCYPMYHRGSELDPVVRSAHGTVTPTVLQLGSPKLTQIRLPMTSATIFLPPLSNITILELYSDEFDMFPYIPWETFFTFITTLPLIALSVGDDCVNVPTSGSFDQRITMGTLKHLRWSTGGTSESMAFGAFPPFLCNLNAPLLETLGLYHVDLPGDRPPKLNMSFPLLHTLTLFKVKNIRLDSPWIPLFARASPKLKNVITTSTYRRDTSLARYLTGHSGTPLWPQLEQYLNSRYINDYEEDPDPSPISDYGFITSRRSANSQEVGPFTLKINKKILEQWQSHDPTLLEALENVCTVTRWMDEDYSADTRPWPHVSQQRLPESWPYIFRDYGFYYTAYST